MALHIATHIQGKTGQNGAKPHQTAVNYCKQPQTAYLRFTSIISSRFKEISAGASVDHSIHTVQLEHVQDYQV